MKNALRFLALLAPLAVAPASATCVTLTGAGICTNSGPHPITTPTLVPVPSANFGQDDFSLNNVGLKVSTGTFALPAGDIQKSFSVWMEALPSFVLSPNFYWALGGTSSLGMFVSTSASPALSFQAEAFAFGGNISGFWWLPTGAASAMGNTLAASKATNAGLGYYAWKGDSSGSTSACPGTHGTGARPPSGFLNQTESGGGTADPGFLCSATPAGGGNITTVANIDGLGWAQSATITNCTPNSPVNGEFTVNLTTATEPTVEPGNSFSLSGASASAGFNTNYAVTGAGGSSGAWTLTGYSATTGTCPVSSAFGTASIGNGSAGSVSYPAPDLNPFNHEMATGIQVSPNQRFCTLIGENGDETNFPGSQYAYATKYNGDLLPGASTPVLSPWLNMGAALFMGHIANAGAQTAGNPALVVDSMVPFNIANAVAATGQLYDVDFTIDTTATPGPPFILGSEFTIAGVSNTGSGSFNGTFVAVANTPKLTPGAHLFGKLLTGAIGTPTAFTGSPVYASGGTAVSVIMPGMQLLAGNAYSQIDPYGQYGSTGLGGAGTYGMTSAQSALGVTGSITTSGVLTSSSPTNNRRLALGSVVTAVGLPGAGTATITAMAPTSGLTGAGAGGTYQLSASPASTISSGITVSGPTTSTLMYAANGYYYLLGNTSAGASPTGTVALNTSGQVGDLFGFIGTLVGTSTGASSGGWNGALGNVGMLDGAFPNTNGLPSTAAFNSLCQKSTDFQQFATAQGSSWQALYRLSDPGMWADSSVASITADVTGNALHVDSDLYSTMPATVTSSVPLVTVAGAGLCSAGGTCPTITTGTFPNYTLSASVTTPITVEAMSVGNKAPAAPIQSIPLTGSIATSGGNGVLTVTGVPTAGAWTSTATTLSGNTLSFTSPSGTIAIGQSIIDSQGLISPSAPFLVTAVGSGNVTVKNNYFPASFTFTGDTLYAYQARVVPGQYVTDTVNGITTPAMVTGQLTQALCTASGSAPVPATVAGVCGTYSLSTAANGTVASESMFMSGIGVAGAIAPGPALTIDNPGQGVVYPITIASSPLTGNISVNGTYDVATLGGTPSFIQAQVSASVGGPPLTGCSACAWTNVGSPTLSGGKWSGTINNIPAGSPYFISVRAANGTGYVTMPNTVGVGVVIGTSGQGNTGWLFNVDTTLSHMSGLGQAVGYSPGPQSTGQHGSVYGPPVVDNLPPYAPTQASIDAYGVSGFLGEGTSAIIQNINRVLGGAGITVPTSMVNASRNGVPFFNVVWDNMAQTQTLGVGDGTTAVFSSGPGYGGTATTFGGAMASATHQATASIATTGVMTVSAAPFDSWSALAPGDGITIGAYSGTIVATAPTINAAGTTLNGWGGAGTYQVAPAPSPAVASGTITIAHNVLGFNTSLGYGAEFTASVSGSVLTLTGSSPFFAGSTTLDPQMVVSDGTNSATITNCLTGCTQAVPATGATFQLSSTALNGDSNVPMYAQPSGGAPIAGIPPNFMNSTPGVMGPNAAGGIANQQINIVKMGTFQVLLNGTVVCSDTTTTFTWQIAAAQCTDAGSGVVDSTKSWINYQYGTFSILFSTTGGHTAPAIGAAVVGRWVNCSSMNNDQAMNNVCWVGNGTNQNGIYSSLMAKAGGVNVWANGQDMHTSGTNQTVYEAKSNAYAFGTNLARLHNGQANQLYATTGQTRWVGPATFYNQFISQGQDYEWNFTDSVVPSTFSGKISAAAGSINQWTAVLTLSSAATGIMWEQEEVDCSPTSLACASTGLASGQGVPIESEIVGICNAGYVSLGLCSAPSPAGWGASGSTYVLASIGTLPFQNTGGGAAFTMKNALWASGQPTAYIGPANDIMMSYIVSGVNSNPEQESGPFSSIRVGQRNGVEIAAAIAGNPSLGSPPTVTRTKITGNGCDGSATAMPCFDIGSTYSAVHTGTWTSGTNVITFPAGISAGARPFVAGQAISCSPTCGTGLYIVATSVPPTESTVSGAGEVGQSFTATLGGGNLTSTSTSGSPATVTAGCSGTSGTGSNCINIAFDINTGGTYSGAAAALNTCGVNNIVGSNDNSTTTPPFMTTASQALYPTPNGTCVPTGIGAYVWDFRIGTAPIMDGVGASVQTGIFANAGSAQSDGQDYGFGHNGNFIQNEAFTCNVVAAKIVQCVLGPQRNLPVPTLASWGVSGSTDGTLIGIGQWPSSGTYVAYGDNISVGYVNGLQGYAGGQSFAFSPGSGYTVPISGNATSSSGYTTLGGLCPTLGIDTLSAAVSMGVAISGGVITDVYPANMGMGTYGPCSFPLSYQSWGTTTGAGTLTRTLTLLSAPLTLSPTNVPVGSAVSVSVSGTGVTNLTLGSAIYSATPLHNAQPFPLIVTACPGTGCGTAGSYTVQNLNPVVTQSGSSWVTTVTNSSGTPPAQTGPITPGQMITGLGLPAGSYVALATQNNMTGYYQTTTYTITCPTNCGTNTTGAITAGLSGGSGGSITTTTLSPVAGVGGVVSIDSGNNLTGNLICDNSGAVSGNPLWGAFNFNYSNGGTTLTAPGLCAKPFGSHRGLGVSG